MQYEDADKWAFSGSAIDGEPVKIGGVNIWEHKWVDTGRYINVKDPIYRQDHVMAVYNITLPDRTIVFAAGEFSNMIWGIYLPRSV